MTRISYRKLCESVSLVAAKRFTLVAGCSREIVTTASASVCDGYCLACRRKY